MKTAACATGRPHALLEREHERHAVGLAALAQHRQEDVELEVLEGRHD